MDRNKLLRIIQRDLNELNEITVELAGKAQISTLEIEFALGKSRIICQEFDYLKELNQQSLLSELQITPTNSHPLKEIVSNKDFTEQEKEREEAEEKDTEIKEPEQDTPVTAPEEVQRESDPGQKTVAEIFVQEKSLNDSLATEKTIDHKLSVSPVSKLEAAIGLNDRFQFIRELFNNDAELFSRTIRQIDQMQHLTEAVTFLNSTFKWKKNETSLKFAQLVKRRFSN
jgi:hypothetical protein